eukprot:3855470-Prymnesium_polylepis.2
MGAGGAERAGADSTLVVRAPAPPADRARRAREPPVSVHVHIRRRIHVRAVHAWPIDWRRIVCVFGVGQHMIM